jgi:hypothetical protein
MQLRRTLAKDDPVCVFPSFDCNWCGVVLNVSPRAEVLELASPALAPG